MKYIKGKVKSLIYEGSNGYKIGLYRLKETNDSEMQDFLNKTITFTGYFADFNLDDTYLFYGNLIYNDKYGYQYKVDSYEHQEIVGTEAVEEFLASPLIKGCGEKTAAAIVETLGEHALEKIRESYTNLLLVPKMTETKALKIYDSLLKYQTTDTLIVAFKKMGLTINESLSIINKYGDQALTNFQANPYVLSNLIDFNKLDQAYLTFGSSEDTIRTEACLIETIKRMEMNTGNTYFSLNELVDGLKSCFNIILNQEELSKLLISLEQKLAIIHEDEHYYLTTTYEMESSIASDLTYINSFPSKPVTIFETEIIKLQQELQVTYNTDQLTAIKSSLENPITIITGGPGTGKTTIINAITKLYIKINNLSLKDISATIALLAPTGRASKKLSDSTGLPASTIHRFLKWNKESNEFQINEYNKNYQKLIIVDETSMIDTFLFYSLLKGLGSHIKLILVGDANQLPSVGPGLIFQELINSHLFQYCPLEHIYRQSSNSYIPVLASEIKNHEISSDYLSQKDDYNFLTVPSNLIKDMIRKICSLSIEKGLTENDIQILVPMYKGENGIDNLNIILQALFNPPAKDKKEIKVGDIIFREHDKILQLVNDPDNNVYNGDIGFISEIISLKAPHKQDIFVLNFDGTKVEYKREDLINIKHAYAITIHKSQGSEFAHVIMPITKNYYKMLYNKLIYTGVSRAKKSLVLIGEPTAFLMAVNNNYSENRHTSLTTKLLHNI